jgi:hypothetical protein
LLEKVIKAEEAVIEEGLTDNTFTNDANYQIIHQTLHSKVLGETDTLASYL